MRAIRLHVLGAAEDVQVVAAATEALSCALSEAAAVPIRVEFDLHPPRRGGPAPALSTVVLLSAWRHRACRDWRETQEALTTLVGGLTQSQCPIFLCTIFRHVPSDTADARAMRVAIRRLNLLAVQLSQSLNVFVIDLDRALADIGALALGADYQLNGEPAARYAGRAIALTLLAAGLDDYASYDAQERARQSLLEIQRAQGIGASSIDVRQGNTVVWGAGRRRQTAATTLSNMQDQHVGWLLKNLLGGKIDIRFAWDKLRQSIARRGWRESFGRILYGASALRRSK